MTKFMKCLSILSVLVIGFMVLVGCNDSESFYERWTAAGAEIEQDNVFKVVSVDDVVEMIDDDASFIVFVGSSTNTISVSSVSYIQNDADMMNYEGKVYFVDITDATGISARKNVNEKLGIDIDKTTDLIAACYVNGSQLFETSRPNSECDLFEFNGSISIRTVAVYAFEYYPVTE